MEVAEQTTVSSVGMNITKKGGRLETSVHRKSTNTGLLLHYHSPANKRYKGSLLITVIHPAQRLFAYYYNIARALVLCKSYCAVMNKIFMYARPCSIK